MKRLVALVASSTLLLVACGEKVDKEGTAEELRGLYPALSEDQANCIVDGAVDEIGEKRLLELNKGDVEPTAEEGIAMLGIFDDCGATEAILGG